MTAKPSRTHTAKGRDVAMASISRKDLAKRIRQRLDQKGDIVTPDGRAVPYLINELKLGSHSTIREPMIEALELLESQGLVSVQRRGSRIDSIKRTNRQRARSIAPTKEPAVPQSAVRVPTPSTTQPRRIEAASPAVVFDATPVVNITKRSTPTSSAPQQAIKVAKAEPAVPTLSPKEIIEKLTSKLEEYEEDMQREKDAHTATKASLSESEGKVRELTETLAEANRKNGELRGELRTANELMAQADEELRDLQAKVSELEENQSVDQLAARVSHFLS